MAKKTITTTEFTDDLDGGTAVGTVSFSYEGANYELDLSKKNKTAMDKAFKPYIDHARRVRATRGRRSSSGSSGPKRNLSEIRAWAAEQGIQVSERGRIAADVINAYEAVH